MGDMLTVASFFSGVGLLDLGLEWAGWRTVSQSEIDPYASRVLGLRYPGVPNLGDLHAITDVPDATLWAGGFPCQPVSVAGKGRAQDDHRWLWPAWAGLIREFRPRILLLENVSNLLAVNDGRAFGDVLGDLASLGYDAEWDCIPAAAVGAPHLRDRVWIIGTLADPASGGPQGSRPGDVGRVPPAPRPSGAEPAREGADAREVAHADARGRRTGSEFIGRLGSAGRGSDVADAAERPHHGGQPQPGVGPMAGRDVEGDGAVAYATSGGRGADGRAPGQAGHPDERGEALADADSTRPQGHRGLGGQRHRPGQWAPRAGGRPITDWWLTEPDVRRVAHGVPSRVDRLRCLGNGVVPQVAEFLGWRIREWLGA